VRQDIIDLYDDYTHARLERRAFMDRLAALAGGTAAAAGLLPLVRCDYAKAAIVEADDARLTTERITYPGKSGEVKAYLARPAAAGGKLPGVVVIHENRGLNPHIEDIARRTALAGFIALAPDFLSPVGGTPADEDEARRMITRVNPDDHIANAVGAVAFLNEGERSSGKVGVIGFCWGGGLANEVAVNSPAVDAVVSFYGRQPDAKDVARIKAPLLLHYAGLDQPINAGIADYQQALEANHVDYTIYVYEGVNHAFNNDTNAARYNRAAAELAWSRTIDFLKRRLAG
jgi:carboxymethylenebutenolidase